MIKKIMIPLAIAVAFFGASCAKKTPSSGSTPAVTKTSTAPLSGTVKVTIKNFAYSPATLVVKKGTVITVTNQDLIGHSFTSDENFNTGILASGATGSVTMNQTGNFKVHCIPHPSITGTITVVE